MTHEMRVDYDDQPNDVVDKVNEVLRHHGLKFVDAGGEIDGSVVYRLMVFVANRETKS